MSYSHSYDLFRDIWALPVNYLSWEEGYTKWHYWSFSRHVSDCVQKRKRKRSDPVLWQKPPTPTGMSKGQNDNTNNATKSSKEDLFSTCLCEKYTLYRFCASWLWELYCFTMRMRNLLRLLWFIMRYSPYNILNKKRKVSFWWCNLSQFSLKVDLWDMKYSISSHIPHRVMS